MRRRDYQYGSLDGIDRRIVAELVADARIRIAEIARRIGLSPPSVSERVQRLEESGVIECYTAIINPAAMGLPVSALIRIRPVPGKLTKVLALLEEAPEIVRCDRVTGPNCLLAKAHLQSIEALEDVVDGLGSYAAADTLIIQSTPIGYRLILEPDGNGGS